MGSKWLVIFPTILKCESKFPVLLIQFPVAFCWHKARWDCPQGAQKTRRVKISVCIICLDKSMWYGWLMSVLCIYIYIYVHHRSHDVYRSSPWSSPFDLQIRHGFSVPGQVGHPANQTAGPWTGADEGTGIGDSFFSRWYSTTSSFPIFVWYIYIYT